VRRNARTALIVVSVAAAAAAGSAFTASNTFAPGATVPLTGYGTTHVTGATVKSLVYNLDGPGTNVTSVTLELAGDTSGSSVFLGFNGGTVATCGTGTVATDTTYTCSDASTFPQNTALLTDTSVVVN
jgi:hypothetical protein